MAEVLLKNIKKSYHEAEVLNDINLHIQDGEFIVILGPSGSGKSTLLRSIAGLEKITEGEIIIAGKEVSKLEPRDRSIAMVFQNYALYPHMTVYNNIAYGLKLHGFSTADIEVKVKAAAEMLELSDLLYRRPSQLSGGQRQRVAMGRAIVREPNVFLFDEPLSNLDAKLRTQMRFEIKNIQKKMKTTSVYVTHDQVEAMTLADRIVLMNKGKIEQVATPLEIYKNPKSIFVAGFIGSPSMNFIDGEYLNDLNKIKIDPNIYLEATNNEIRNKRVIIGMRPEKIKISPDNSTQYNEFPVNVMMIESLGSETLIYANISNTRTNIVIKVQGNHHYESGQKMNVYIARENVHIFDAQTGLKVIYE